MSDRRRRLVAIRVVIEGMHPLDFGRCAFTLEPWHNVFNSDGERPFEPGCVVEAVDEAGDVVASLRSGAVPWEDLPAFIRIGTSAVKQQVRDQVVGRRLECNDD